MVKIDEQIPKNYKTHPNELVKPIIPLARPENNELEAWSILTIDVTILPEILLQEST